MTARDSEIGFDLARAVKNDLLDRVPQPDAAAILQCCCWLLADLITQAMERDNTTLEHALALVMVLITTDVTRLTDANEDAAANAVTH